MQLVTISTSTGLQPIILHADAGEGSRNAISFLYCISKVEHSALQQGDAGKAVLTLRPLSTDSGRKSDGAEHFNAAGSLNIKVVH